MKRTIAHTRQTRYGFHVARLDIHHNSHAKVYLPAPFSLNLAQAVAQRLLRNVLHCNVERRLHVAAVFCRKVYDAQVLIEHFLPVIAAGFTAQDGIVRLFDAASRLIFSAIEVAHGARRQSAEGVNAGSERFDVEAAAIGG